MKTDGQRVAKDTPKTRFIESKQACWRKIPAMTTVTTRLIPPRTPCAPALHARISR